jgi:hypothetical protein
VGGDNRVSQNIILLTGLPRSGTNLTCTLLNKVPNTVALSEPMNVQVLCAAASFEAAANAIEEFGNAQRRSLLTCGRAVSKHRGGAIMDNFFSSTRADDGLRASVTEHGETYFDKALEHDFRLVLKHPAAFTALLPETVLRFPCFALLRNPMSVLASWNANRIPVRDGHAPAAERIDAELRARLDSVPDRIDRQIVLLGWFFRQFRRFLADWQLIRYEDLIHSGGAILSRVTPAAEGLNVSLQNRNRNPIYDWRTLDVVAERLLASEGDYWAYYTREDVRALLGEKNA